MMLRRVAAGGPARGAGGVGASCCRRVAPRGFTARLVARKAAEATARERERRILLAVVARAEGSPRDVPVEEGEAPKAEEGGAGGAGPAAVSDEEGASQNYKPSSSGSWGLFERPDNISKAYGGGKNIPFGGEKLSAEDVEEKRKKTLAKIQQYKKKKLELANADLGDDTLSRAKEGIQRGKALMLKGSLTEAREEFQNAAKLVSPASSIGGEAQLQIAICCDSMGRYDEAKEKYKKLTTHRDFTISRQAENFLFGFDAQDMLKTEKYKYDANTYRPYFDVVSTGEWDTMYVNRDKEDEETVSLQDRLIIASVFAFPILLILGLRYWQ